MRLATVLGSLLVLSSPGLRAQPTLGTVVEDVTLDTLEGGKQPLLGSAGAAVLVFARPGQERSAQALKEFTPCAKALPDSRWVVVVSDSVPAADVRRDLQGSGFPVLLDKGDTIYGALRLASHPVVLVVNGKHQLSAFEPFRNLDYCAVVSARVRQAQGKLSAEQVEQAVHPAAAERPSNGPAHRQLRMAQRHLETQAWDKALEGARRAAELDPALAAAFSVQGQALLGKKDCPHAVAAFRQALALDAHDPVAAEGLRQCPDAVR